jgi:hypothetical protein
MIGGKSLFVPMRIKKIFKPLYFKFGMKTLQLL